MSRENLTRILYQPYPGGRTFEGILEYFFRGIFFPQVGQIKRNIFSVPFGLQRGRACLENF